VGSGFCPACGKLITVKQEGHADDLGSAEDGFRENSEIKVIYPQEAPRTVSDEDIPENVRNDFNEAAAVLPASPKASAALSRRLLQHILRDEVKVKAQDLSREVDEFLSRPGIPTNIRDAIDAVRDFGNFASHPNRDKHTGEIWDVEPGEADWSLDLLELLFDFAYIQPARTAHMKGKLNAKLAAAGKPPMK
jgi:hypothetical protein